MFGERFREKYASRIDQQADIFVFGVNGVHHVLHTFFFHQVGNDDRNLTISSQRLAGLLGFVLAIANQHNAAAVFQNQLRRFEAHTACTTDH